MDNPIYQVLHLHPKQFTPIPINGTEKVTILFNRQNTLFCRPIFSEAVSANTILVIPSASNFSILCKDEVSPPLTILQFPICNSFASDMHQPVSDWISQLLASKNAITLQLNTLFMEQLEALLRPLHYEYSEDMPGSNVLTGALLAVILGWLGRIYHFEHINDFVQNKSLHGAELIAYIKLAIEKEYASPLCLKTLADRFYITPAYLSTLFHRTTGISFVQFVNYIRINHAKQLLLDTDELVVDISDSCGFNSAPHFNLTFRKITGFSPLDFRSKFKHAGIKQTLPTNSSAELAMNLP